MIKAVFIVLVVASCSNSMVANSQITLPPNVTEILNQLLGQFNSQRPANNNNNNVPNWNFFPTASPNLQSGTEATTNPFFNFLRFFIQLMLRFFTVIANLFFPTASSMKEGNIPTFRADAPSDETAINSNLIPDHVEKKLEKQKQIIAKKVSDTFRRYKRSLEQLLVAEEWNQDVFSKILEDFLHPKPPATAPIKTNK